MVFDLLGKGIRQPRETAHLHAHRKVRPLDVRRADMLALRVSRNARLLAANALGGTVATDRALRAGTIDFDEHAVVDIAAECLANGIKIDR
jgi:hypothetical protein